MASRSQRWRPWPVASSEGSSSPRASPKRSSSSASTAAASSRISRAICFVAARRALRRVGVHLRAVDGDHPDANQAGLGAERQHLTEQLRQRGLVALTKARDRRVIRTLVGADHARGDILDAAPLDPPRRALAERVAVEQQRDHHRRIVRRPALTVVAVDHVERPQIQRRDGIDHKPRQMPLGQPLAQTRRQQQLLITITRKEVLRHPRMVLTTPDGPALCATATPGSESEAHSR